MSTFHDGFLGGACEKAKWIQIFGKFPSQLELGTLTSVRFEQNRWMMKLIEQPPSVDPNRKGGQLASVLIAQNSPRF